MPVKSEIRSYTSVNERSAWLGDFARLWRGTVKSKRNIAHHVSRTIAAVRSGEEIVKRVTGVELRGLKMLEVGVGQLPRQMGVFATQNEVIGIDLDVIPQGIDVGAYTTMLRTNGAKRVAKTLARKAIGFDRAFLRELARQLGVPRFGPMDVRAMDATKLAWPDATFDCVYSFDVFEHFPEPGAAFAEIARVLKPGGISFTSLHPITTEDGFHDLRIIAGEREGIPYWAHLRPQCKDQVQASAYLNGIRVSQWREIVGRHHPDAHFELTKRPDEAVLRSELAGARSAGDLGEYSDEELLCERLIVVWQRPGAPKGV